jgi:hypothetical protein
LVTLILNFNNIGENQDIWAATKKILDNFASDSNEFVLFTMKSDGKKRLTISQFKSTDSALLITMKIFFILKVLSNEN